MKLIILTIISLYTTILSGDTINNNLCVTHNNYQICPTKDSKIINTLSILQNQDISNDKKSQIAFNNYRTINDYMKFCIIPGFEGYMTIVSINSNGVRKQLFPNETISDNYVKQGELLDLSSEKYKIQESLPAGVGYFIVTITNKRAFFSIARKDITFDAFTDDKAFEEVLSDIKSGKYGKHFLKLLPYYTYKEVQ